MEESLRLGRIAGVRVGINWSVLAIFALIWLSLSGGRFPLEHPGRSTSAYAAAGGFASVVFFVSLLAHEVAHAVVARRNGIEVEGITLWLFGGVARLSGEAADPGAELRIAGVGPLVSLVLSALFLVVFWLLGGTEAGLMASSFGWLGAINLALAVFNLVPAAPLDGGRILRAFLWRRRHDRLSATITASRAGKGFGALLIGLGLVEFAFGQGLGGMWFVLIGWFLINAANSEEQYARMRGALAGVRVGDVMTVDPTVTPAHLSVQSFLDDYVFGHRHSTFPLVEEGRPVGLISLQRVKQVPAQARATTSVRSVACPMDDVPTASPDQPLAEVLPAMRGSPDGRLLVVVDDTVRGIVSPTDVSRVLELADLSDLRDNRHV
ncbi:MAG TPA: site-2 protease family protein [Nitriliruptorales bacterium]|nr:site-2 protease family protein [Nitriliruptorales bacterium]